MVTPTLTSTACLNPQNHDLTRHSSPVLRQGVPGEDLLKKVQAKLKAPLAGAAHSTVMRGFVLADLRKFGVPVVETDGATTAFNRERLDVEKSHANDAALAASQGRPRVGMSVAGHHRDGTRAPPARPPRSLRLSARTAPTHQVCERQDRRTQLKFQTGDIVRAVVPKGKKTGNYLGRHRRPQ